MVSSSLFFPFSALPVVEGVGVTLTQFHHGGSHYHSNHFSLTHCELQPGQWPFTHSLTVKASADREDRRDMENNQSEAVRPL